ncbi:MAG: hypothetical protein J7L89_05535, partial [Bacteroidales bacterium]|nr:hypothetical protein [Bacteroidales bacterium]
AIMITFGETFQFTLNSNGLVRGFKASESLKQKFDSLTNVTNAQNQMLAGLSSGISSESGLSQMLQGFMIQYPGQAVKKGKTWEKEEEFDQLIPFKTKTIYTLKKSDADGYQINVNKQITQKDSTSIEMQGMTMEYDLSGSGQGTYTINSESGLVIHGEIVTSITGLISVDSPQLPTPMTIPMTFKTTETTTLK